MTFEQAKAIRDQLDAAAAAAGRAIKAVPGVGTGPLGLTPDAVKASPEWRAARAAYDTAAAKLRGFNMFFTRQFARELRAERRARSPR